MNGEEQLKTFLNHDFTALNHAGHIMFDNTIGFDCLDFSVSSDIDRFKKKKQTNISLFVIFYLFQMITGLIVFPI